VPTGEKESKGFANTKVCNKKSHIFVGYMLELKKYYISPLIFYNG
jgi:hypothetical protein